MSVGLELTNKKVRNDQELVQPEPNAALETKTGNN